MTLQNGDNLGDKIQNKIENIKKDSKDNNILKIRLFIIIGLVVFINVITILKFAIDEFKLNIYIPLLIISIVGVVVTLLLPKITASKNKEENKKELPKPITLASCQEIAEGALKNNRYCNEITQCLGEDIQTLPVSQNLIYHYIGEVMYKTKHMKEGIVHILINMNFPDMRAILIDPTIYDLNKKINSLGNQTEKETPLEEVETRNDITGITQILKKPVIVDKEKKEEKGDLE